MAVDQARHGERHVSVWRSVVVQRVAGEVAGIAALEQGGEVVEGARQRREIRARKARGEEREHDVADPLRVLDIDAVGDVVLV